MKLFKVISIFLLLSCMAPSVFAETWYVRISSGGVSEWTKKSGELPGPVYYIGRTKPPIVSIYDVEMYMTSNGHISAIATDASRNPKLVCTFIGTKQGSSASGTVTCNTGTQLYTWNASINPSK